jgi:hypothetical protein
MLTDTEKETERFKGRISAYKNSIKDGRAIGEGVQLASAGPLREKNRRQMRRLLQKGREEGRQGNAEIFRAGVRLGGKLQVVEDAARENPPRFPRLGPLRFPRLLERARAV